MSAGMLFFVHEQPFAIRRAGAVLLVQCPACGRASAVSGADLQTGDEGPSLATPNDCEIICGYEDCRAAYLVWRGRGIIRYRGLLQ